MVINDTAHCKIAAAKKEPSNKKWTIHTYTVFYTTPSRSVESQEWTCLNHAYVMNGIWQFQPVFFFFSKIQYEGKKKSQIDIRTCSQNMDFNPKMAHNFHLFFILLCVCMRGRARTLSRSIIQWKIHIIISFERANFYGNIKHNTRTHAHNKHFMSWWRDQNHNRKFGMTLLAQSMELFMLKCHHVDTNFSFFFGSR